MVALVSTGSVTPEQLEHAVAVYVDGGYKAKGVHLGSFFCTWFKVCDTQLSKCVDDVQAVNYIERRWIV